ncbi:MAG: hypothetical protein MUE69_33100 [Myxococcota bacterium]|nr:hypothetical protein [Myxococcota bacterium]
MTPLLILDELRSKSLQQLRTERGIKARVHGYKASLNYDQIEARDDDPVAQQCRGLVLATRDGSPMVEDAPLDDLIVLARPFDRFFNHGQGAAASIDIERATVWEKVDGTLIVVYFDEISGAWCVATRAVCEGDVPLGGWTHHTFRTLFETTLREQYKVAWYDWTSLLDRPTTYLFELCTPTNQVVVKHETPTIWALGSRSYGGHEYGVRDDLIVPVCPSHNLASHDDVMALVRDRDPARHEGVVLSQEIAPGQVARVKVKNAGYLALSRVKDITASPRGVMTLILGGHLDDALDVMMPDARNRALRMADGLRDFVADVDGTYHTIRVAIGGGDEHGMREHRKAFAIAAKSHRGFDVLMALYNGQATTCAEYLRSRCNERGEYPATMLDSLLERIGGAA